MPGNYCENHAEICETVETNRPKVQYRGRMVRLCHNCATGAAEGRRLKLDARFDREDKEANEKQAHRGYFNERERAFHAWLNENPSLWAEFVERADEMRRVQDKCSAWLVVNVIRWNRLIKSRSATDFKISNDFIGFLARRYMENDPANRGGFFDIKPMKGEDMAITKKRCGFA